MPCFAPLRAWRSRSGEIHLGKSLEGRTIEEQNLDLYLPCGGCLGCRMARAKAWALRNHLELQQHDHALVATLTYDDAHLPPTLDKRHLQLAIKRLRHHKRKRSTTAPTVRFFGCGEYGEKNKRPHYHAILYGIGLHEQQLVTDAWRQGHVHYDTVTPASIAYIAGYTAKKMADHYWSAQHERVDPTTGEVYSWQPPFIQMSRNPGIGAHAREHAKSWRLYAVHNGYRMPVPRYLHEAWKAIATNDQLEELLYEKSQIAKTKEPTNYEKITAAAKITEAKHQLTTERRTL